MKKTSCKTFHSKCIHFASSSSHVKVNVRNCCQTKKSESMADSHVIARIPRD